MKNGTPLNEDLIGGELKEKEFLFYYRRYRSQRRRQDLVKVGPQSHVVNGYWFLVFLLSYAAFDTPSNRQLLSFSVQCQLFYSWLCITASISTFTSAGLHSLVTTSVPLSFLPALHWLCLLPSPQPKGELQKNDERKQLMVPQIMKAVVNIGWRGGSQGTQWTGQKE